MDMVPLSEGKLIVSSHISTTLETLCACFNTPGNPQSTKGKRSTLIALIKLKNNNNRQNKLNRPKQNKTNSEVRYMQLALFVYGLIVSSHLSLPHQPTHQLLLQNHQIEFMHFMSASPSPFLLIICTHYTGVISMCTCIFL